MSTQETKLKAVADAIRKKLKITSTILANDFPAKIESIPTGTDTSDATATAGDILADKTAYTSSGKVTGTIPIKSSSNLGASGATVTVPAGYYSTEASKSVATATQAIPSMTRSGATVTATVAQDAGYVSGGTKTNSLTVPSAGILSGTLTSTTDASWGSTSVGGIKRGTGKFGCTLNQTAGYTSGFSNGSGSFNCNLVSGGTVTPTTSTQSIVPAEYSAYGEIKVAGDSNLIASNIKKGISIFGVNGTYEGSSTTVNTTGIITITSSRGSSCQIPSSYNFELFICYVALKYGEVWLDGYPIMQDNKAHSLTYRGVQGTPLFAIIYGDESGQAVFCDVSVTGGEANYTENGYAFCTLPSSTADVALHFTIN